MGTSRNRIITDLAVNDRGLKSGLSSAEKTVEGFSRKVGGLLAGAFAIGTIQNWIQKTIDWGSATSDFAVAVGTSAENMQVLEYAVRKTGGSVDDVMKGFRRLSQARLEALSYSESKQLRLFEALGISKEELQSLNNIDDLFARVAKVYNTLDLGSAQLGSAQELLGRSGTRLMPLFIEGLEQIKEEAKGLGFIVSDEVVQELDRYKDIQEQIIQQMRGPFATALVFLGEKIQALVMMLSGIPQVLSEATQIINEDPKKAIDVLPSVSEIRKSIYGGPTGTMAMVYNAYKRYKKNIAEPAGERAGETLAGFLQAQLDALKEPAPPRVVDNDIDERLENKLRGSKTRSVASDSLAKIGGFTGRGNVRQENTFREMKNHMRNIDQAANNIGIKLRDE